MASDNREIIKGVKPEFSKTREAEVEMVLGKSGWSVYPISMHKAVEDCMDQTSDRLRIQ